MMIDGKIGYGTLGNTQFIQALDALRHFGEREKWD
jgi:hypothetical protein